VAHNRDEFLAGLDEAVRQASNPEAVERRLRRAAAASWDSRVAEVLALVQARLEEKAAGVAAVPAAPKAG